MTLELAINPWKRIFAPFAVGYFLSYLLRNANAVISPELTQDLGLTATDLGLLTSVYMLAFGAFQLPLGILLDRFGPRRVEAALLLICAAGAALFGLGDGMPQLTLARAMIGLGVSACLMASFKSFSLWFPIERQASLNAAIMAAGGLGALAASSPLGALLPVLGWRGIFYALAAITLLVSLLIYTTPEKPGSAQRETLGQQLAGLGAIFRSRAFWRFAPQTTMIVGGFMALQGLWAVPFMMTVNGMTRQAAAFHGGPAGQRAQERVEHQGVSRHQQAEIHKTVRHGGQRAGRIAHRGDFRRACFGRAAPDTQALLLQAFGPALPVEEAYARKQYYLDEAIAFGGVPIKPGLLPLLDLLDTHRIPKAVASSTHRAFVLRKLNIAGLTSRAWLGCL